jgi:large repetitive protein
VVSNAGPTADPGPITVTDALPAGLSYASATGTGWVCSAAAEVVTCTAAAGLAVGQTSTISLVVDVGPLAFPTVTNVATVTTPSEETKADNNSADDTAPVSPLSELEVVKRLGQYDAGSRVATWRITVTNHGPNPTQRPVVVSDVLVTGLSYVSATGSGWACGAARQTITCTYAGSLPVDATTGFTLETAVVGAPGETITNTATLVGNVDPVPENDTSSAQLLLPAGGGLSPTGASAASLFLLALTSLMLGGVALASTRRRPRSA